ncbi:MAG: hypothetical protein ABFD08_02630 [Syntrophomonas sp.]
MKRNLKKIMAVMIIISFLSFEVTKVKAMPIAVPAGAVVVIAGGLVVAGCYSNDHESMTNMVEYTWNHIPAAMQEEAVKLSLYKDTGVIIGEALLSAIGDAITQRFGDKTGTVIEAQTTPVSGGYTWPTGGVSSFTMDNGDVYSVRLVDGLNIDITKNGNHFNGVSRQPGQIEFADCGISLSNGLNGGVVLWFKCTGYAWEYIGMGAATGTLAYVASDTTWSWDLEGNRADKEPKRIPLPPGGIPDVASDADDWAWNNTGSQTSDSIDNPVTGDDVTADTAGIAGAVRSIRNLVNSIAEFFNPALQPTLNFEPLKVSVNAFTTRFPFSLPWDFLRAFTSMKTDGTWQPAFQVTMPAGLPVGDVFDFEIDLSMWQEAADLARKLELLAFDIGLILLTRKLLGGGV